MTDGPAAAPIPPAATEGGLSPAEYARIYEAEQPRLVAYARSLTGNPWLADDLVAEAHFRVWRRLAAGHDIDNVAAYLTTTVRNLAASAGRGAARETPLDPHTGIEPVQVSTDAYGSGVYGDQDPAARASAVDLLSQVLGQLPQRWVKALWLSEAEGQPLEAVGRGIGAGSGATAVLLHRAREGMRQAFLRAHPGAPADPACEGHWERMPAYVRGNASPRQSEKLLAHVDDCDDCRKRLTVLLSANDRLPALVGPALLIFVLGGAGKFLLPLAVGAGAGAGAGAAGAAGSASSGHGAGSGLLHGVRHVLTGGSKTQGAVAGVLGVSVAGAAVAAGLVLTSNGGDSVPPQRSAAIQSEKPTERDTPSQPSRTSPTSPSSKPSTSASHKPVAPRSEQQEQQEQETRPNKQKNPPPSADSDSGSKPAPSDSPAPTKGAPDTPTTPTPTPTTSAPPPASERAAPPKASTPEQPSPSDTPSVEPTPTPTPTPTTEQPSATPEPSTPAPSPSCTRWLGPIHICHILGRQE